MEKALEGIEEQLKSEPIVLTLDILRHAKRFHATVSFIADTGLKEAADTGKPQIFKSQKVPTRILILGTASSQVQPAYERFPLERTSRRHRSFESTGQYSPYFRPHQQEAQAFVGPRLHVCGSFLRSDITVVH